MRYDLHCHTQYSTCSLLSPAIFLRMITKKMDGIAVTDHDTLDGYYAIKKLNKNRDFEIIKAVEKNTTNGHLLAYYINSVPKSNDFFEAVDSFKSQGALLAIAHPFSYVGKHKFRFDRNALRKIDALECRNASMSEKQNSRAVDMAGRYRIAKIGGSDSHFVAEVGLSYTIFDGNLRTAIKKRKTSVGGTLKYFVLNQMASMILHQVRK